jgi:hypothetical protein
LSTTTPDSATINFKKMGFLSLKILKQTLMIRLEIMPQPQTQD